MPKNSIDISIIIVNYKVHEALFDCLESVYHSKINATFEIIVVDNDERKTLKKKLITQFPDVIYVPNPVNNGWGGGINLGIKYAKGTYYYFLNPDTTIFPDTLFKGYSFIKKHPKVGVAASLILDPQQNPHTGQGSQELTPLKALVVYSMINKFFPKNVIANKFWPLNLQNNKPQKVPIATLTGSFVNKDAFIKAGQFDEQFFLYFEEQDLGKRINLLGFQNYIIPESKIIHLWGLSSKIRNDTNEIFLRSRCHFLKKYYGLLPAYFVEWFLRFNKRSLMLILILFLATFLRLFRLDTLMTFQGDQGWFFLAARNMLLTGVVPLVGITSSHTWLHQGPLWIYLIAPILWLFHFSPIAVGYFAVVIDVITLLVIYRVSVKLYSKNVGFIVAILYATSPLIVEAARMPYHTTPIPLLVLLFIYCLYQLLHNNKKYLPFSFFLLGLLYNFELNTILLGVPLIILIFIGLLTKASWSIVVYDKRIWIISFCTFLFPMLPVLVYDTSHGFVQTAGLSIWVVYKLLTSFGLFSFSHGSVIDTNFVSQSLLYLRSFIFASNLTVSLVIFVAGLSFFVYRITTQIIKKNYKKSDTVLALCTLIPLVAYLSFKIPSAAYLPVMLPGLLMIVAIMLNAFLSNIKTRFIVLGLLGILIIGNILFLFKSNFFIGFPQGAGPSYQARLQAAQKIVLEAKGREYNLIGKGEGSEFASYIMNYEYLTWMLGNPPVSQKRPVQFRISETSDTVIVQ